MVYIMNRINKLLSFCILIACVVISCSDSGTSPVVEEQELPSLEASVNYQSEVGTERTHLIDSEITSDGIVVLGSYKDLDSSCLRMKLFLLKVDFDGTEIWRKKYDNIYASKCDQFDLEVSDTNGIAVFAATAYPDDFFKRDYHIYKFSSVGDLMWEQILDYSDQDVFMKGTVKENGELVAYPIVDNSFRQVTLDANGNVLEDIESPIFSGNSFNIFNTPSKRKIYTSINDKNTALKIYDSNLQFVSEKNIPFGLTYLNETTGSDNGYYAYNGELVKLDSNFETEWSFSSTYSSGFGSIHEIAPNKYATLESRSFSPGGGSAPVISVIGDGGEVLSRTIANTVDGFYPEAKKILSRGNGDVILVYVYDLDIGVSIYQNEF